MNLEGSLDAFGLPDVFALLASTGKSGGLLLRRVAGAPGSVEGAVWFRDGRICGATSDRSRASLVRRVVGSGAVDDAGLRQAVARAMSGGVGVARALLESGAVEPELMRQAATDQAVDAVFDLLRWPDGDFGFDPASSDADDVGISLDHERVLAEARARAESWSQLEALVPSPDSVLAVPVVLHQDPEVSRDEWALLALVDGRRRVRDLVELTGCGDFAVTTTLAHLVQRGLLHVRDGGPARPRHDRRAPDRPAGRRRGRSGGASRGRRPRARRTEVRGRFPRHDSRRGAGRGPRCAGHAAAGGAGLGIRDPPVPAPGGRPAPSRAVPARAPA